jgi:hypothetical protein
MVARPRVTAKYRSWHAGAWLAWTMQPQHYSLQKASAGPAEAQHSHSRAVRLPNPCPSPHL